MAIKGDLFYLLFYWVSSWAKCIERSVQGETAVLLDGPVVKDIAIYPESGGLVFWGLVR